MTAWTDEAVARWEAMGTYVDVAGHRIFTVDAGASPEGTEDSEPLVIVHGFPTSSFDFAGLVDSLAAERRVVLVDLLGFGLSDKPDVRYTMALQADVVAGVVAALGLTRFALLTHDMGDTVGGELLARNLDGSWPVDITRRVITNGSIYIEMANLTAGQLMLLDLPDARAHEGPGPELMDASLRATLAPANQRPSPDTPTGTPIGMRAHAELVCHLGGDALLPRTIRYIEERRENERRFTGAIEAHPSPLHVIWGPEDPIAVAAMADRLVAARADSGAATTLTWVVGAGHYPQIEDPDAFTAAVRSALS